MHTVLVFISALVIGCHCGDQTSFRDYNETALHYSNNDLGLIKEGLSHYEIETIRNSEFELPYIGLLSPKSFGVGRCIRIEGRVMRNANSFNISLQVGLDIWPQPITAFYFNARYKNESSGSVHINAWYNGRWLEEKPMDLGADLIPGKSFSLVIVRRVASYEVYVNNKLFTEFRFQISAEIVDTVYVNGDIRLGEVVLENYSTATAANKPLFPDYKVSSKVYSNNRLGVIKEGLSFIVTGYILPIWERFWINLSQHGEKDIAMQVSFYPPQTKITRHFRLNNVWGGVEYSDLPSSVHRGSNITIQILVTENCYMIAVNGRHHAEYKHHLPYKSVTSIDVYGDIANIGFERIEVPQYPESLPESKPKEIRMDNATGENLRLEVPYYGLLPPKSFGVGRCIRIEGRVIQNANSFNITLQVGQTVWPQPIIAFHFNARYTNESSGSAHINAWYNRGWTEQRRNLDADLFPGKSFSMVIVRREALYEMYVNNKLITEFRFQISAAIVDTLYVNGDVRLGDVVLENYLTTTGAKPLFPGNRGTLALYMNNDLGVIVEGLSLTITGNLLPIWEEFWINLTTPTDIILHFLCNRREARTKRNTRINNVWGVSKLSDLPFSLRRGSTFSIQILVTEYSYLIAINGRHHAEYKHRFPYKSITSIKVMGDVDNISFNRTEVSQYPEGLPYLTLPLLHKGN